MATDSRRQLVLLGALAVVLAAALWWQLSPEPGAPAAPAAPRPAQAPSARRGGSSGAAGVELVRLDALAAAHARPTEERRDPFRFKAEPPPAPRPVFTPNVQPGGPGGAYAPGAVGALPSGPPPMALKFIGILKPTSASPIAVLTNGKDVFYGREGETVDGRYRIQRIGVESIEMEWADGRGRQVIRLSGS
jgi:hypothetical protein